jgi:uncharacterized protein YkwD
MHRRLCILVLALGAMVLGAPATASAAECAGADIVPAADNLAAVGQATLCLINQERAARGLRGLSENRALSAASATYSQRMVQQAFFAHESPDGGTLVSRLKAARYLTGGDDWVVGENIGWGQGPLATPRSMVTAWMNSASHRVNILAADYREVGLGLAMGTPPNRAWGATYTTDFGRHAKPTAAARTAASRRAAATRKRKAVSRGACARSAQARKRAHSTQARKRAARKSCARLALL